VVIGGGLMDPESPSVAFRERCLKILRETDRPYPWPVQRDRVTVQPLGELSQAIGAGWSRSAAAAVTVDPGGGQGWRSGYPGIADWHEWMYDDGTAAVPADSSSPTET
jgi:hypothetical protein